MNMAHYQGEVQSDATAHGAIVKSAETRDGWAIGIIERRDRNNKIVSYGIIRINPQRQYVILYNCFTMDEARESANQEWAMDRGVTA
jgi:hypothetical protein